MFIAVKGQKRNQADGDTPAAPVLVGAFDAFDAANDAAQGASQEDGTTWAQVVSVAEDGGLTTVVRYN